MAYKNGAVRQGSGTTSASRQKRLAPLSSKTQSITYSTDTPDLLLDLNATSSASVSKSAPVGAVKVRNDGYVPAISIFAFNRYSGESTVSGTEYVQYLLNPNDEIIIPATRAIISDAINEWDGTVVTETAPNSNEYTVSGTTVNAGEGGDHVINSATATNLWLPEGDWTSVTDGPHLLFSVGDLIRVNDEIMEVTAIGSGADGTNNNYLTVIRGLYGSTAATHTAGNAIRFPFFNAYHDWDKYSASQTNSFGRYKATNFFGLSRTASGQGGISAGSIAIQFYEAGYQSWNMQGITSNSESGLAASTEYGFDITVDGSGNLTSDYMKFTTDASNTKFGGSSGIIAKMQSALDTYYYTTGSSILNERVYVSLEGGDVVFRSGSHLSTSAILLAAPSAGETTPFGVGLIPAIGSIGGAVAARLQTETVYDPVTNSQTYKQIFIRDDGSGNLIWQNSHKVGTINYETGAIDFTVGEKPNAEFVVSCTHSGPFSGKLDPTAAGRKNCLVQVLGNTPQQKCEAVLTIETYESLTWWQIGGGEHFIVPRPKPDDPPVE